MKKAFSVAGFNYELDNDRLKVKQCEDVVLDICLSPVLSGEKVVIDRWEKVDDNYFQASLGKFGQAFVCEKFGKLAYWIETPVKQFENVTYLSDGVISGDCWRTFVSDEYERLWDKNIDTNIPISSAYENMNSPDGFTGGGMTDPDDIPPHWIWNVHVRVFALKGRQRWLGVSIPGPWGISVMRMNMHRARLNLKFEYLQTGCTEGKMPVVYFCPNLADGFDSLDEHRILSEKLGLMDMDTAESPEWWAHPWYKYWDESERLKHLGEIGKGKHNFLDLMKTWIKTVQEDTDFKPLNITLEQGCFRLYGDYRPAETLGTEQEMHQAVDAWHEEGIHVGHYIHPFLVNTKVQFYKDHPEAFCKAKQEGFLMDYPLETWDADIPKFAPVDWTHPLGRKFILNQVEYLLSSEPGCRNMDILRSNNWRSPDPRCYDFHDPDWGVGDLMTFKVQKLMYEKAKSVKPDCMVSSCNTLDCYMQPACDIVETCEDWTHNTQYWYRRGQLLTRLLRNRLMWTCAWFCTRTKWNEYFMAMSVWGVPETEAVRHTTHPYYPSWFKLEEKHLRRRKSGIAVYMNSPLEAADESRVTWDFENLEIYRKKTVGPLAGWYAALALSPKCFVTYSPIQAMLASTEDRLVDVPLPPNAKLEKVFCVYHDGREQEYEYVFDDKENKVRLYIEDCGKDVLYYKIQYSLK